MSFDNIKSLFFISFLKNQLEKGQIQERGMVEVKEFLKNIKKFFSSFLKFIIFPLTFIFCSNIIQIE